MGCFCPDYGAGFILNASAVNTVSSAGQLDASQSTVYIYNEGPNAVCIRLGKGSPVATVNDLCIPAGSVQTFGKQGSNAIAAICASGSAKLHICGGRGE